MKRLVLFSAAIFMVGSIFAQSQKINKYDAVRTVYAPYASDGSVQNDQMVKKGSQTGTIDKSAEFNGKTLGTTTYDLQTNNTVHDRAVMNSNGNISVVWTASLQSSTSWTDRGAGYSHYNGSYWEISSQYPRIESDRCGWPSILYDGNGGEIIISHSTAGEELRLNSRSSIGGTAAWTEKTISTGYHLWNRAAMGGNDGNTIHIIAADQGDDSASYQNIYNAILYYRSQDAGSTFDITELIIPGLDSGSVGVGRSLSADAYAIAAKGNHVVIGVFPAFNDVMLLESTDNGTNWTKTIVHDFPYQGFRDFALNYDSTGRNNPFIETNDGAGSIIIDENDEVHMVWGRLQAYNDPPSPNTYFRRSFLDSLQYYRHGTPGTHSLIANWVDANGDSLFNNAQSSYGWQSGSILTYPNLSSSSSGDTILLTYAGITDSVASFVNNTRLHHIFFIKSDDNGNTWSNPIDLTPFDEFYECVYGDLVPVSTDRARLVYQRDAYPSVYVSFASSTSPSTNYQWQENISDNEIVYLEFTFEGDPIVGIEKVLNQGTNETSLYPNPSKGMVQLNVVLYQDVDVNITVHNLAGQNMYTYMGESLTKGKNNVSMDLSHLDPGMYVVNINAGGKVLTEKVIIE